MKKLLERREVMKELSSERKQEIDEGVKLAKKVDSLRQTYAKEEAALNKFRAESIGVLNAEISRLILDRDSLKVELESLGAEKAKLLEPLAEREERARVKSLELTDLGLALSNKKLELDTAESVILEKEKALSDERSRIEEMLLAATSKIQRSQDMFSEATLALSDADSKIEEIQVKAKAHEKAMNDREAFIRGWEREFEIRRGHQDKRELELNRRETLVTDRYQTLLRTEQRLKK